MRKPGSVYVVVRPGTRLEKLTTLKEASDHIAAEIRNDHPPPPTSFTGKKVDVLAGGVGW
jgi:hypothetical protein